MGLLLFPGENAWISFIYFVLAFFVMDDYKAGFITHLLQTGALRVGTDHNLKSKRTSPWFVNMGDFNDGQSSRVLGEVYSRALSESGIAFDTLYGIPQKGNALAVATAYAFADERPDLPWFFTRPVPKEYGEATGLSSEDRRKALVVGRAPEDGNKIAQLDDVFTAGTAKYDARDTLESLGNFEYPVLAIAVDRQEVGLDGRSAITDYEGQTGTKVLSVVNASDIYSFLRERALVPGQDLDRMANYLRVYGTQAVRETVGKLEQTIVGRDRSVIPA